MSRAAPKLAAAPITPPANISRTPMAVPNSSIPTTSSPIGGSEGTETVLDYGGPKKRESVVTDKWHQPTEFRSWKISFKSEVSHSSQYPRAAMLWIGEIEDAESFDDFRYFSICHRKTNIGLRESWFQDCNRTQENPNRKFQDTSHHSRTKYSIREEITHGQTDYSDDLRLLQN